jgi:hypothetical protein
VAPEEATAMEIDERRSCPGGKCWMGGRSICKGRSSLVLQVKVWGYGVDRAIVELWGLLFRCHMPGIY